MLQDSWAGYESYSGMSEYQSDFFLVHTYHVNLISSEDTPTRYCGLQSSCNWFSQERSREQWYCYCSRDRFWENRVARTLQTAILKEVTSY